MSTLDEKRRFVLNEKVVYPGHGVAYISCLVEKVVGGAVTQFFELSFYHKEMTILVPVASSSIVGLRKLSSKENVEHAFKILYDSKEICLESSSSNWNRRNKDYQTKLRSGNLYDICKIYRDLKRISTKKELSFGEKSLLSKTESLLVEEIAIVNGAQEDKIMRDLRSIFV
jgi:Transcriptional regulators, similar to M. xanthus CarD